MTTEIAKKTHWKQEFNFDYLGAYSLDDGKEKMLTIKSLFKERVKGTGGKTDECLVCYWQEKEKPMILNRTNCKTITKMTGSPYIEDWVGKQVVLYIDHVKAFGEEGVEALRIRPFLLESYIDPAELEAASNALMSCESLEALKTCLRGLDKQLQHNPIIQRIKDKQKEYLTPKTETK